MLLEENFLLRRLRLQIVLETKSLNVTHIEPPILTTLTFHACAAIGTNHARLIQEDMIISNRPW